MNRIQKISTLYIVAIVLLTWGYAIGKYEVFPYGVIHQKIVELVDFYEGDPATEETLGKKIVDLAEEKAFGTPVQHLAEKYGAPHMTLNSGIKIRSDELLQVNSWWDDAVYIRLLDHQEIIVKKWKIDTINLNLGVDPFRSLIYGLVILPDGSVMFNYGDYGLVKADKCGKFVWALPGAHHLITVTSRGTFWVARLEKRNKNRITIEAPYDDDFLVEINQLGEVLREISFIDLLIENYLYALLFSNGQPKVGNVHSDMIHINEIEELNSEMAANFSLFSAGDVVVSSRNLNLLLVLDPETRLVKWYQIGPFLRQHDPDFQANGTITMFNNNTDESRGSIYGGSNILEIHPESRDVQVKYSSTNFYSSLRGVHQILEDGRMLIVESTRGRVFMVDQNGKLIFEFIEKIDGKVVQQPSARIYKKNYFEDDLTCNSN